MARSAQATRRKILETAYELFYRRGFSRVSVDDIAARAKLTKRTLYYHFRSKDDLLAAVLAHYGEMAMEKMRDIFSRLPPDGDALIDSYFEQLARWAAKSRWSGAGFTRVVMELADLPGHPARAIAKRHKAVVESCLADALSQARIRAPRARAREIMLLMEGAMAMILIHGDLDYARAAAAAAKHCLSNRHGRS